MTHTLLYSIYYTHRSQNSPVYIKYNSSDIGNAYMKPHNGNFSGVIFQPKFDSNDSGLDIQDFMQFGDLPTGLFR